jgi:carbonic anhydrase/acetyltransferase-like protein (isoleucine patch superfamily)
MAVYRLGNDAPIIPASAHVAKEATVVGKVKLGEFASVWPGAVIRGDDEPIHVGERANVQGGAVLHTYPGCPLFVGDNVTVGHQAVLHGCTIGAGSLIGIHAVVCSRAVIGKDCLIGPGSLVTEDKVFPDRSLIVGVPARVVRQLTDEDIAAMHANTDTYVQRTEIYKNTTLTRID